MGKKKVKNTRGYATTSVPPLVVPTKAVVVVETEPEPEVPVKGPSTTTMSAKQRRKKEALTTTETAQVQVKNIKPYPLPSVQGKTSLNICLGYDKKRFSSYAEYEDALLDKLRDLSTLSLHFEANSVITPHFSRFDLETVYETLTTRDQFGVEDVENAMTLHRGCLSRCYDWLAFHATHLPSNWVGYVSTPNDSSEKWNKPPRAKMAAETIQHVEDELAPPTIPLSSSPTITTNQEAWSVVQSIATLALEQDVVIDLGSVATADNNKEEELDIASLFDEQVSQEGQRPKVTTQPISATLTAPMFTARIARSWRSPTPRSLLLAHLRTLPHTPQPVFTLIDHNLVGRVTLQWKLDTPLRHFDALQPCADISTAHELAALSAVHALDVFPNPVSYLSQLPPEFHTIWHALDEIKAATEQAAMWARGARRVEFVAALMSSPVWSAPNPPPVKDAAIAVIEHSSSSHHDSFVSSTMAHELLTPLLAFKADKQNHLPIYALKSHIVAAHFASNVVLVSAETGSGKSTQVPQYLLEAHVRERGYWPRICITQPRRISATSLATRVGDELGDTQHRVVGYAIRGHTVRKPTTSLLFVTTGVLLHALASSSTSRSLEFDIIILDEVHERTMECDVLMVCLRRLLGLHPQLRVVLMSATMEVQRLADYFAGCSVLSSSGNRRFEVPVMYLEELLERTGYVPPVKAGSEREKDPQQQQQQDALSVSTLRALRHLDETKVNPELIQLALEHVFATPEVAMDPAPTTVLVFLPGLRDLRAVESLLLGHPQFGHPHTCTIQLLHSSLIKQGDFSAFFASPHTSRVVVLATNLAETGITLPHVRAVVDTCRVNELRLHERKNLTVLKEEFCSRASAEQRRGRAGRLQAGLCVRLLYSSTYQALLAPQSRPEIQRVSLSEICLKLLGHPQAFTPLAEFFSQALDPPGESSVSHALGRLARLGCITSSSEERLTRLGMVLAWLPMDAALGRILLMGCLMGVGTRAALVCALISFPSGSVFAARASTAHILHEMRMCEAWERATHPHALAREQGLDPARITEALRLQRQYLALVQQEFGSWSDRHGSNLVVLAGVLAAGLELGLVVGGMTTMDRSSSSSSSWVKIECQDRMEAKCFEPFSPSTSFPHLVTYLERVKVQHTVVVTGLTPVSPAAVLLFTPLEVRYSAPVARVELATTWLSLKLPAPRSVSLWALLRSELNRALEACLAAKRWDVAPQVVDLVADVLERASAL